MAVPQTDDCVPRSSGREKEMSGHVGKGERATGKCFCSMKLEDDVGGANNAKPVQLPKSFF